MISLRHLFGTVFLALPILGSKLPVFNVTYNITSKIDNLVLNLKHFRNESNAMRDPKTIMLTIHGYGDTSEYYSELAEHLAGNHDIDVITFDQRMHGQHKTEIPYFKNLDSFEADVVQILEFLREKYASAKIVVYGHSMGGGILGQLCLRQSETLKSLNIRDFVFESPFLQIHPSSGKWYIIMLVEIFNAINPAFVLPDELNLDFIANNPEDKARMEADDTRTKFMRAATVMTFLNVQDYFELNTKFWDSEFRTSIHIAEQDQICDRKAIDKWFSLIKNEDGNELYEYQGACHDLKADFDPTVFFENVARFVNTK